MIRKILVPLDGSSLSEAALPGALWMSKLFSATVFLLHVIERNAPASVHGERHLTNEKEAMAYLKSITDQFPNGVQWESHVHTEEVRDVARSIGLHAGELAIDLVVMCAHGKSGLRQMMVGNIAQQVISFGSVPVLLIQPQRDQEALFKADVFPLEKANQAAGLKRPGHVEGNCLLVALDEDPEHACGLELAGLIAGRSGIPLRLLNVVPKLDSLRGSEAATGKLLPVATSALLELEKEGAVTMLSDLARPLLQKGIAVTVEVRRGDPSSQIAQAAQAANAMMIVLGTHGKSGFGAFWAGSVAPRMPDQTDLPLLLVPTCRTYAE